MPIHLKESSDLMQSLTQDDLKHLYEDAGLIQNVLRIEVEEVKAKKKITPNTGNKNRKA